MDTACVLEKTEVGENRAYFHERWGMKDKGERKVKFLKHILSTLSSFHFLKKISRSRDCILPPIRNPSMQHNFTNPSKTSNIFLYFGVIIPDCQLPKCTKTRKISHTVACRDTPDAVS